MDRKKLQGMSRAELHRAYGELYDERECCDDPERVKAIVQEIALVIEEVGKRKEGYVVVVQAEDGTHYLGECDTYQLAVDKVSDFVGYTVDATAGVWYSNYGSVLTIEGEDF